MNRKGFILSTYVYMLLVFFLLLLTTMLAVMNNTKLLSNKLKEQSGNTSGLIDKDYSFILLGEGDMVLRKGDEYIEPGFKIQTSRKKDLSDIVKITGNVDVNNPNTYKLTYSATYNGITKKLTRNVHVLDNIASNYISGLYEHRKDENNLTNPKVTYNNVEYDTGIRYTGANPNNYVYFNCEEKDSKNVAYGIDNYDYANSCEVWRMIGVFDISNGTITEKRVKLINTASTFTASWDSSADGSVEGETAVNRGWGINQWGVSGEYKGADLMKLLNGYYIGVQDAKCTYCNGENQENCGQNCTTEDLKSNNMKVLTNIVKGMIENVVWDTYAIKWPNDGLTNVNWAGTVYLEEKGISTKNMGNTLCIANGGGIWCNDNVERMISWTGLVGLMSVSDITYADGWLYSQNGATPWSISPVTFPNDAYYVCRVSDGEVAYNTASHAYEVFPSLYLSSNVKIVSGDGTQDNPYKLSI